jgi:hypothetical protein
LSDIQLLSSALVSQQHLVEVLTELTDLKQKLLTPRFNLESVLPPKLNTRTKGRKPSTKRLASAVEIYEEALRKNAAKKSKLERTKEKRIEKLNKLNFIKESLAVKKEISILENEIV